MDTTSGVVASVGYPFELGVNMVIAATAITGFNLVYNQVNNSNCMLDIHVLKLELYIYRYPVEVLVLKLLQLNLKLPSWTNYTYLQRMDTRTVKIISK